jgi:hypothetical protein
MNCRAGARVARGHCDTLPLTDCCAEHSSGLEKIKETMPTLVHADWRDRELTRQRSQFETELVVILAMSIIPFLLPLILSVRYPTISDTSLPTVTPAVNRAVTRVLSARSI